MNNSLIPQELKWLYKEIWTWRAAGILIVIMFTTIEALKWAQLNKHEDRSIAFESAVTIKQDRIISMLDKHWAEIRDNGARISEVDEHLRQCSGCHSHPKLEHYRFPKALPGK